MDGKGKSQTADRGQVSKDSVWATNAPTPSHKRSLGSDEVR